MDALNHIGQQRRDGDDVAALRRSAARFACRDRHRVGDDYLAQDALADAIWRRLGEDRMGRAGDRRPARPAARTKFDRL